MKVLILSHNCVSQSQNMGKTLVSLFGSFDKTEIVQLYLYPSVPKLDFCKSFYRITDNDVIRSILRRGKCGGVIEPDLTDAGTSLFESDKTKNQYAKADRGGDYKRYARDILWKLGTPKSKALKEWLDAEKPDIVFYALGDAVFSLSLARWISSFLNIPLVTYVCDDFYFSGKEKCGIQRLLYNRIIRNVKKTVSKSSCLITICDELGEAYKKEFNKPYHTAMTGSSFESGSIKHTKDTCQISYIGNLGLNRWKSLLDIKEVLDEINSKSSCDYKLVYYGREMEEIKNTIQYGGMLDADGVKKVMSQSLMLIHTEGFDMESKERVKYSFSTKIADSLASGTCLLAYGSEELASISYLKKHGCAVVAVNKKELKERLYSSLLDTKKMQYIQEQALLVANQNHNAEVISQKIKQTLEGVL